MKPLSLEGERALPIAGSDFNSPPTIEAFLTAFPRRAGEADRACLSHLTGIPAKMQRSFRM